ncbi:MAG: AAA family ATPase [Leptospirales bacterium]
MKISYVSIENIRCFEREKIDFSDNINIIVGPNNSGKSTLLKSVLNLQVENQFLASDKRLKVQVGKIEIRLKNDAGIYFSKQYTDFTLTLKQNSTPYTTLTNIEKNSVMQGGSFIQSKEPENYIYPFLSRRKAAGFSENINLQTTNSITGNLSNLYSKIDRISNPEFLPAYEEYIEACENIIGFRVSTVSSRNGKKGAYIIRNADHIPIENMGEGITNLLGLIVDLCIAENKLFLIEEPENDIHPKALKALLRLIQKKSSSNQFIITTHSNIVVKTLGGLESSKVFSITTFFKEKIPTSNIQLIDTPEMRLEVLEALGYEVFDFDLWQYWIFFEESSAERIIKDYIIPIFIPKMVGKVRTYSARSLSEVEIKFSNFNSLFVYIHLTPSYKNKAWVILDSGSYESEIIANLKKTYCSSGWSDEQFLQFSKHDFESYYPKEFQSEVASILILDKEEKRGAKKLLLEKVISWLDQDKERARVSLKESATDVISLLSNISKNFR